MRTRLKYAHSHTVHPEGTFISCSSPVHLLMTVSSSPVHLLMTVSADTSDYAPWQADGALAGLQ